MFCSLFYHFDQCFGIKSLCKMTMCFATTIPMNVNCKLFGSPQRYTQKNDKETEKTVKKDHTDFSYLHECRTKIRWPCTIPAHSIVHRQNMFNYSIFVVLVFNFFFSCSMYLRHVFFFNNFNFYSNYSFENVSQMCQRKMVFFLSHSFAQ